MSRLRKLGHMNGQWIVIADDRDDVEAQSVITADESDGFPHDRIKSQWGFSRKITQVRSVRVCFSVLRLHSAVNYESPIRKWTKIWFYTLLSPFIKFPVFVARDTWNSVCLIIFASVASNYNVKWPVSALVLFKSILSAWKPKYDLWS